MFANIGHASILTRLRNRSVAIGQQRAMVFVQTLHDLLRAGIDLPWALETCSTLIQHEPLRKACLVQAQALQDGVEWPDALDDHSCVKWPRALQAWSRVAVATGATLDSLGYLLSEWQHTVQFRQTFTRKLAYPAGVLCMALALTCFTASLFEQGLQQALTLCIGVLIATSTLAVAGLYRLRRRGGLLEIGVWLRCVRAMVLCSEAGLAWPATLDRLLSSLQPLLDGNVQVEAALLTCSERVRAGASLRSAAEAASMPLALQRTLSLAQMTGDLTAALRQSAALMEVQQQQIRQTLLNLYPAAALALAGITLAIQYVLFIQPLYAQLEGAL